ncbi:hypothetical protein BGX34_000130 [Mortierella sp. NVP85]|nr:hypothetical protein BGX34_000130 [Mortierella sp. NVP85]
MNPVVDYPTINITAETEAESSSMASGTDHGKRSASEEPSERAQSSKSPSMRSKKTRSGDWLSLITRSIKEKTEPLWQGASYETINTIDLKRDVGSGKLADGDSQKAFDLVPVDMLNITELPEILELALNNFRYTLMLPLMVDFLEVIYPEMSLQ